MSHIHTWTNKWQVANGGFFFPRQIPGAICNDYLKSCCALRRPNFWVSVGQRLRRGVSAHACLGLVIEDSEVSRTRSDSHQKQNLGECESLCGSDGTDLQPQLLQTMQQDPMFRTLWATE